MPPSTATQRETFCLTLSTVYSVTPAFAHERAPRLDQQPLLGTGPLACAARTTARDVVLDRRRRTGWSAVYCTPSPPPRSHTGKSPSFASSRAVARGRAPAPGAASRCARAAPAASGPRRHARARSPRRRVDHREAELRVGLAGGDLLVRLPASRRASPAAAPAARPRSASAPSAMSCAEPLDLVEVVDHDQPARGGAAPCAAPPRTWRCRAARSARARSPHSAPGAARRRTRRRTTAPPAANSASTAVQGNALDANTTWKSSCPRGPPARRRARARAGRPRRRRRRACRTRAPARSCRSRRPPAGRARSGGCRAGTRARGWSGRHARIIACRAAPVVRRAGAGPGASAGARQRRRRRRRARAIPPATSTPDQAISAEALELRRGQPGEHLGVAADELDQEALQAAAHEVQREHDARAARGRAAATARRRGGTSRPSRRSASAAPSRPAASAPCRAGSPSPTAASSGCRSRRRRTPGSRSARSRSRARAPSRTCRASAARARWRQRIHADHPDRAADRAAVPDETRAGEDACRAGRA